MSEQAKLLLKYSPPITTSSQQSGAKPPRRRQGSLLRGVVKTGRGSSKNSHAEQLDSLRETLRDLEGAISKTSLTQGYTISSTSGNAESDDDVVSATIAKSAVAALGLTIDRLLQEALDVENHLDWWRTIESSRWRTAYYLLQSEARRQNARVSTQS